MLVQRAVLGTLVTAAALMAGCYTPKLKNFGFQCDPTAVKPCPDGFFCRNGFCDDGSGGTPPVGTGGNGGDVDMAMSEGGDGGGGSGGGGGGGDVDMAMSTVDMAQSIPDMAQAPPDMVVVSTCKHDECTTGVALSKICSACAGAVCAKDSYCCSSTTGEWDSKCVGEVKTYCTTKTCP
jgi:hypothetical protein